MRIDVWTLALQAVNFLVLAWLLHRFLYRPVLSIIARRQKSIAEAFARAAEQQRTADADATDYRDRLNGIEEERRRQLEAAHRQAETERAQLLAAAEQDAARTRAEAETALKAERTRAEAALARWSAETAVMLAGRLLREAGARLDADAFLARTWGMLDGLDGTRGRALAEELAGEPRIEVASAPALADDAQACWRARLQERFGARVAVDFAEDAALIAGAELRFPHTVIAWSWRDLLAEARTELADHGKPD
ncbi:MAG TPA: F0F1 ATP synthase subunit delta [Alphaproteobacteria bacterium]|jgi:F-type H+-transporting ATPase subunit b|nr:F0F1 ATP synthase subunit delta [Alphaproteobacteria bacterium]